MRSLVAPTKCRPDKFEVWDMPTPTITDPRQVLVRVHASAINSGEVQIAAGGMRLFHKPE